MLNLLSHLFPSLKVEDASCLSVSCFKVTWPDGFRLSVRPEIKTAFIETPICYRFYGSYMADYRLESELPDIAERWLAVVRESYRLVKEEESK